MTKRQIARFLSPGAAVYACLLLAAVSVALAFPGSAKTAAVMSTPVCKCAVAVLALWMSAASVRSLRARRFHSMSMHLASVFILAAWLMRTALPADASFPEGTMTLADGDVSSEVVVADGTKKNIPFEIKLEKFFVKRYGHSNAVREFRSRLNVRVPGAEPYYADVKVNHPARVLGYWIYQDSWGRNPASGEICTVLKLSLARGWHLLLAGYFMMAAGTLLSAISIFRRKSAAKKDCKP